MDASRIPRLETSRLILRAHRADDLDACAAMWADPRVVRYISGKPSTRSEAWSRMARYVGLWAFLGYGFWAVEERDSGAFVGDVGFTEALRDLDPPISGIPEAGWVLVPAFHGRGYASEAIQAALDWADRVLGASRTVALIASENAASLRLGKRFGYHVDRTIDFSSTPTAVLYRGNASRETRATFAD